MRMIVVITALCGLWWTPQAIADIPAEHPSVGTSAVSNEPIRVAITCEIPGRTKVCPAFLLGFLDANKVLLSSPRAGADVLLFVAANQLGVIDRVHMRFVGQIAGAPPVIELDADVNTRDSDDEQRASIEPVFMRGLALFVAARYPFAVKTELTTPSVVSSGAAGHSPWALEVSATGTGSYTERYQSASTLLSVSAAYIETQFRARALAGASGAIIRQPPLMLDDGTYASLNSNQWYVNGGAEAVALLDEKWSIGIGSYQRYADPYDQYRFRSRSRIALEWDLFPANDPRGNRLSIFYHIGWGIDRYNLRNVLGERFAQYPLHGIDALGSVRHDKVVYGIGLSSDVQVTHPSLRYSIAAEPFIQFQIGDHIDISASLSVTRRTLPAPDPAAIDPLNYAEVSRLSYADPLAVTGSLGVTVHWDATNGVRNNRLESI